MIEAIIGWAFGADVVQLMIEAETWSWYLVSFVV